MNADELQKLLDQALGALADIAFSEDMTPETRRRKAERIYREINEKLGVGAEEIP